MDNLDANVSLTGFVDSPAYKQLASVGAYLVEQAQRVQITNKDEFDQAANVLQGIRAARSRIISFFSPLKTTANRLHKEIVAREKEMEGPYRESEEAIRRKMENFVTEEKRRINEEAERLRKQQEENILSMATAAEERGDNKAADALMNIPVTTLPADMPLPEKLSTRQQLVIEVTDVLALVYEVAEGRVPADVFEVNKSIINDLIRQYGLEQVNKIKGLRCFYKPIIVMKK